MAGDSQAPRTAEFPETDARTETGLPAVPAVPAPRGTTGRKTGAVQAAGKARGAVGPAVARAALASRQAWSGLAGVPSRLGRRRRRGPGPDVAGTVLGTLSVVPALLVMAWLLTGLPLLLAGEFVPVPVLLIAVPLAVALIVNGLRSLPARWPRVLPGPRAQQGWAAWWGAAGTVVAAAGFAGWQFAENSPSLIVTRDPGAYVQTGYWIAQHGSLPIPQSLAAFGGAHAGLHFASTGFFAHGTSVVPSFLSGLPMLLAGGFWTNGISGAAVVAPVLGGLAVLAFGGLVARLAGPQWAPAGALVLGLTLTEQYTSRNAFPETAVQVLLFGGLCLVIDALAMAGPGRAPGRPPRAAPGQPGQPARRRWRELRWRELRWQEMGWRDMGRRRPGRPDLSWQNLGRRTLAGVRRLGRASTWAGWLTPPRIMAALGGLALGLTVLISIGSLVYLLAVIPFAAVLAAGRRPVAFSFCLGVIVGTGYGIAAGYLLSRPFLDSLGLAMELTGLAAVWLVALSITVVQLMRVQRVRAAIRRMLARAPLRWLPEAGAVLTVAALIAFAVRPYFQTVRGHASAAVLGYVGLLQRAEHLPLDPTRQYAEDTLYWAVWYVGVPAVLLGGFGAALLVRRCLRALLTWQDPAGAWRNWALPMSVICAGSAAVLGYPAIVPDQPWAARRLVPVVIPGLIICALWAAAWLAGRARERGARAVTAGVVGLFCVAALAVPTVTTTFGIGLTHSGRSGGLRPTSGGMAFQATSAGETGAVRGLCASLGRSSAVVIVSWPVAREFTQLIRGMCGVPAGWMVGQSAASVRAVLAAITAAGRHPVLLGSRPSQLAALGGAPVRVLDLRTTQDPHELTQPPTTPWPARYVIWMSAPSSAGLGT